MGIYKVLGVQGPNAVIFSWLLCSQEGRVGLHPLEQEQLKCCKKIRRKIQTLVKYKRSLTLGVYMYRDILP